MTLQTIDGPILLIGDDVNDRPVNPPNQSLFFDRSLAQLLFFDGSSWSTREYVAVKAADQIVNNSATLVGDLELFVNVVANATYILDSQIIYDSGTTPDIKFAWFTFGSTSTLSWTTNALGSGASGVNGSLTVGVSTLGNAGGVLIAGGAGTGIQVVAATQGILTVGNGGAAVFLRWAQNVADPSDTTVHADSWMRVTRIA
jgi:hypothetical protein